MNFRVMEKIKRPFSATWIFLLICFVSGCASLTPTKIDLTERNGVLESKRWWNYYFRGIDRLKAGDIEKAKEDFKVCIGEKKAPVRNFEPRDNWNPRTYGMHYITNYFPHRELGYCYYKQGKFPDAIKYLEVSLQYERSDRAMYYLKKAYEKLKVKKIDRPRFEINTPKTLYVRSREYYLKGKAQETDTPLIAVKINDEAEPMSGTTNVWQMRKMIPLYEGTNRIDISAKSLSGGTAATQKTIIADWQKPIFAFFKVEEHVNEKIFHGFCTDNIELKSIIYNQMPVPLNRALRIVAQKGKPAQLVAWDKAGNVTSLDLHDPNMTDLSHSEHPPKPILLATTKSYVNLENIADDRPQILFSTPADRFTIYEDSFYLDGWVKSPNNIAAITVNEKNAMHESSQGSKMAHFRILLNPEAGTNAYDVKTIDEKGKRDSKLYQVFRKESIYKSPEYALRTAMSTLGEERKLHLVRKYALQAFGRKHTPRFYLQNKDPEIWEAMIKEYKLNHAFLANQLYKLKPKLKQTDYVFVPTIYKNTGGITIRLQVVNAHNFKTEFSDDVFVAYKEHNIQTQLHGLASKIERQFPQIVANALVINKNKLHIDKGEEDGLRPDIRCILVRPGSKGVKNGKVLNENNNFLECILTEIEAQEALGTIQGGKNNEISKNIFVIPR